MTGSRSEFSLVSTSSVLALLAGLTGILFYSRPLETRRTPEPRSYSRKFGGEDIDARLWQDPLTVVDEFRSNRDSSRILYGPQLLMQMTERLHKRLLELRKRDESRSDRDSAAPILLMPVLIPGGPYSEDGEIRRRLRQALVSAFTVRHYVPESGEHVGAFEFVFEADLERARAARITDFARKSSVGPTNGQAGVLKDGAYQPTIVPYEWFVRSPFDRSSHADEHRAVLVLWLHEHAFGTRPLTRVTELVSSLVTEVEVSHKLELEAKTSTASESSKKEPAAWTDFAVKMIGPSNSSVLAAMVDEQKVKIQGKARGQGGGAVSASSSARLARQLVATASEYPETNLGEEEKQKLFELLERGFRESPTENVGVIAERLESAYKSIKSEQEDTKWAGSVARITSGEFASFWQDVERVAQNLEAVSPEKTQRTRSRTVFDKFEKARKENKDPTREVVETLLPSANGRVSARLRSEARRNLLYVGMRPGIESHLRRAMEIYSNRATASRELLLAELPATVRDKLYKRNPGEPGGKTVSGRTAFLRLMQHADGPAFISTICTDEILMQAILGELDRRHVDIRSSTGNDHVVLIGEFDTLYARALPLAFRTLVNPDTSTGPKPYHVKLEHVVAQIHNGSQMGTRIHQFGYMRGIDGIIPSTTRTPKKDITGTRAPESGEEQMLRFLLLPEQTNAELPIGRNQFDHMRRLASKIRALNRRLHDSGERVAAVGVVGSDPYDKLAAIQAVREALPAALLFTTDLDARTLHATQRSWTRNLVVASSFGLELHETLQGDIPPFRDVYQTSTFLAVQLALGGSEQITRVTVGDHLEPRLYEIGRTTAYDLTPVEHPSKLHPPATRSAPSWSTSLKVLLVIVAGLGLFIPLAGRSLQRLRSRLEFNENQARAYRRFAVLGVFLLVAFLLAIWVSHTSPTEEPFLLLEGISVWPTEILRVLAGVLCIGFLIDACGRLREHANRIGRLYLGAAGVRPPVKAAWRPWNMKKWWAVRRRLSVVAWAAELDREAEDQESNHDTTETESVRRLRRIWSRYRLLGQLQHRFVRVIPVSVLYIFFGVALMLLLGFPNLPTRGDIGFWADKIALVVGISGLVLLTFFVLDANRLSAQLCRAISSKRSCWPATAHNVSVAKERGLKGRDIDNYLDVQLISQETELVGGFIKRPFIVLFVMILSRTRLFDNWDWPPSLILLVGVMSVFAIASGVIVRKAAERARNACLERIGGQVSRMRIAKDAATRRKADSIEMLAAEIRALKRGAFSPLTSNPVLQATLIPFGGFGILALLEIISLT